MDYVYRSKFYPLGAAVTSGNPDYAPDVASTVRPGVPTRMLVSASWGRGVLSRSTFPATTEEIVPSLPSDEQVKITVNLGKTGSDYVILDTAASPAVDQVNRELSDLAGYLPSDHTAWGVQFTVTLTADPKTSPDFVPTEMFTGYTYITKATGTPVFRFEPFGATEIAQYQAVSGVQAQFIARDTNQRVAVGVSNLSGVLNVMVPPGTYDLRLYGHGFNESQWLTGASGVTVASGSNTAPFGRTSVDVVKQAEFNQIKTLFSSLYWPGYMIPEDFTDVRGSDRDDPEGSTPATQHFGRIYAGRSWVEYVGIAVDPSPL